MGSSSFAQTKRLWVLQPSGEMVEYNPATFAIMQRIKVPPEALKSPSNISINRQGQILFASDRKSTRLNSSHRCISYAVFCLKKKNKSQYAQHYTTDMS